jgi:hypothetical protein
MDGTGRVSSSSRQVSMASRSDMPVAGSAGGKPGSFGSRLRELRLLSRYLNRGSQNGSVLPGAFIAWPLSLGARAFAVNPAPKGAPLTRKGIDRSARRARGGHYAKNARKARYCPRTSPGGRASSYRLA